MLVDDKGVMQALEAREGTKELTVPITREEYSEYMMLRLMLAEAIDGMMLRDGKVPIIVYSLPVTLAEQIMPSEFQVKLDELILENEFRKNEETEAAV